MGNGRKTRFIGAVGPSAEIMPLSFFIHSLLCDHHPPRSWMDDLSSPLLSSPPTDEANEDDTQ